MISSTSNAKIKFLRSLQTQSKARQEAGCFVIEGVRLLEEALVSGWPARMILHAEELDDRTQNIVAAFSQQKIEIESAAEHVMKAASDTQSPQGVLAVLEQKKLPLPFQLTFALLLDSVRDPGNLGAILRSGTAAGVEAVFLSPGCADVYSPKVVRAAMGAHFRLPAYPLEWEQIEETRDRSGLNTFLADAGANLMYTQADFRAPVLLVIGGEAHGASQRSERLAAKRVRIPMRAGVESLNAAAAAAIMMFEVARQRAGPGKAGNATPKTRSEAA